MIQQCREQPILGCQRDVLPRPHLGSPVAEEIEVEDLAAPRQVGSDPAPHDRRERRPVKQHQRLAATQNAVANLLTFEEKCLRQIP
jgi:hypothetical protein